MKRAAKIRMGTYLTVFDSSASFTSKIKILCLYPDFTKLGMEKHKMLIFKGKEALKSKTVKYVPILIFATLFISGVKISNFEYYVIGHYVISGYVIGIKNLRKYHLHF